MKRELLPVLLSALLVAPLAHAMQAPSNNKRNDQQQHAFLLREQGKHLAAYNALENSIARIISTPSSQQNPAHVQAALTQCEQAQTNLMVAIDATINSINRSATVDAKTQEILMDCWNIKNRANQLPLQNVRTRLVQLQRAAPRPAAAPSATAARSTTTAPSIMHASQTASTDMRSTAEQRRILEQAQAETEQAQIERALKLSLEEQHAREQQATKTKHVRIQATPTTTEDQQARQTLQRLAQEAAEFQRATRVPAASAAASSTTAATQDDEQRLFEELEKKRQAALGEINKP